MTKTVVPKKRVTWTSARLKGRLPPQLMRCPGCGEFLYAHEKKCPHCGGALARLKKKQLAALKKAAEAAATLERLFSGK